MAGENPFYTRNRRERLRIPHARCVNLSPSLSFNCTEHIKVFMSSSPGLNVVTGNYLLYEKCTVRMYTACTPVSK